MLAIAAAAATLALPRAATADARFYVLQYHPRTEAPVRCSAMTECDVTLEVGERVREGYAADASGWDPQATYSGPRGAELLHLIFRAARPGMATNVVVPTNRRTYYLALSSDSSRQHRYYAFAWPRVFVARAARTPAPAPTARADALAACLPGERYTWSIDRTLPDDHPPHARPNLDPIPAAWTPAIACTDGRHTFVQFAPSRIEPGDLPVLSVIGAEGDTLTNYTYDQRIRRFRIDGVPDRFVLELGSQASPLRIVLTRTSTTSTSTR
jgi:type IV secretion system protein TrbG